ncbi:MAG: NUDIX domain-containing protein [Pseudomonadota bacterium]
MVDLRTRFFQAWFRLRRPLTLGVRGIVEDTNGRVLLVRHTYTPGLYLPGGGVEKGEPAETALARELVEEAGIQTSERLDLIGVYSNHKTFPNDHVLVYRVAPESWSACPATSRGEIAEIIWTDPLQPPSDTTPGNKRRLAEVYGGQSISPYW